MTVVLHWPMVVDTATATPSTSLARRSIFGRGLASPMQLDVTGARPLVVSEEILVKMGIMNILFTDAGERPFLVKQGVPYGTRIRRALFEDADVASDIVKYDIKSALSVWEPRIVVQGVQTAVKVGEKGGATLMTNIIFRYRSTNRSDNLVVPFSLGSPQ